MQSYLEKLADNNASFEDLAIYAKQHGITVLPETPGSKLKVVAWNYWTRVISIIEKYDIKMTVEDIDLLEKFLMSLSEDEPENRKNKCDSIRNIILTDISGRRFVVLYIRVLVKSE